MHTGEDGDRPPVIDRDSVRERQARIEIEIATPEVFQLPWGRPVYVADIGKPVGAQQRLADILRGETDDRRPGEPDGCGLQRRLGRRPAPRRKETGGTGQDRHG